MPVTRLLVEGDGAWQVVGEAALDADDPGSALSALRKTGEEIAGGAFSCQLILPNDQIKYLSVDVEAGDDAAAAKIALEGATPYPVSDLAFDWARSGKTLFVAAVARETLEEATGFVTEHGFKPTGHVAHPEIAEFPVRPVFDSADIVRGRPVVPVGGAYVPAPPSPPPAFASRREAPPVAPPAPEAASTSPAPRITLSPRAEPAVAAVGAATPPAPVPSPAVTGKSAAAVPSRKAPPPPEPDAEDHIAADKAQIGGKPRYLGLVLSLVLLAILAVVALWSMTLGDPETAQDSGPPVDLAVVAEPPEEAITDVPEIEIAQDALPDIDAPTEELLPPEPVLARPSQPMTDSELAARYAATGIWQRAPRRTTPPAEQDLDQLYVASIDPQVPQSDAVALPDRQALTGDTVPQTPTEPAPLGQTYALDDAGRVIPTPDGAVSPDGILVFAGRPPITVAPRVAPVEDTAPEPDARLAALRPAVRPDGLQDANERAQLGGRTLEEFASIRPQLRPKAPQELAAEIAAAAASAAAAVENPPDVPVPQAERDPFATGTQLASATSRKPQTRPQNFDRIVARARAQDAPAAGGGTNERAVASVAPRAVRPSGPVPTTVSRAATIENAINLRRINLIGVFGKPTSRSALIRLRNGRFKKVQVGDRIDGGRVAAIGESELRYVKSGRNLTLTIPSG